MARTALLEPDDAPRGPRWLPSTPDREALLADLTGRRLEVRQVDGLLVARITPGGCSSGCGVSRRADPAAGPYHSLNSRANSTHSPFGASRRYATQCGLASAERASFSSVTAR
jgi:hypothetical protein